MCKRRENPEGTRKKGKKMEAWVGIEPTISGFANRPLNHSSTTPCVLVIIITFFKKTSPHFKKKRFFFLQNTNPGCILRDKDTKNQQAKDFL